MSSSSSSSSQNIPQCYYYINQTIVQAAPDWVPCYTPSAGETHAPCCQLGSYCLEGNFCFDGNGEDLALYNSLDQSPYYTAGCTDQHYADPEACTTNCEKQPDPQIIYNDGQWQCCAGNCSIPSTDDEFRAPAPGQFQTLTSLAVEYAPYETYVIESISNSILSLELTNMPSFSAAFNSYYGTSIEATWLNELPSAVVSEIIYGSVSSDIYTGPATLSATASVTMPVTTMPTTLVTTRSVSTPTTSPVPLPAPSSKSKSNAAVIGPAVGVPVAVLLIAAIVGAILYYRRRRRRQATANRGAPHADQGPSHGQQAVTQYPSGPPPFYGGSPNQQVAENPSYNTYASSENHYQSAPFDSFAGAPTSNPQLASDTKKDGPVFGATAGPVRETLHELESPGAEHELESSPLGHA